MGCHLIFSVQFLLVFQFLFLFEVKADDADDLLYEYGVDRSSSIIDVFYGDTGVDPGDHLTPVSTVLPPSVSWDTNPSNKYYTLFFLDPDSLSTDVPGLSNTQFLHWYVSNIVGNDVSSGTVLADYVPPGAPPGMKLHNYIFLLYSHYHKKNCGPFDRTIFDIVEYASKCNLGIPVGYNYFKGGASIEDIDSGLPSLM